MAVSSLNATIDFFISLGSLSKHRGTNYYEYNLYYDYETEFSPTDEQKEYPYSFYQNYEPKNVVNLSAIDFRSMKFHNGKLYLIPIQHTNNRYTKVREWKIEFFDADYLGETEKYIFYTSFIIDKKTGKHYGFEIGAYKRYAIFDGILYFNNDSSLFSTETLSIKNNY